MTNSIFCCCCYSYEARSKLLNILFSKYSSQKSKWLDKVNFLMPVAGGI